MMIILLVMLTSDIQVVEGDTLEACNGEDFTLSCRERHIIIMHRAEYGRREVGRCIPEADQFMGCVNDVLPLLDTWCSGRQECRFAIPNSELEMENKNCLKILRLYVKVDYTCMQVDSRCRSNAVNALTTTNGVLTTYQADTRGCGLQDSPWLVTASPGQSINFSLTDFSVRSDSSGLVSCHDAYGVIEERSLGIKRRICGQRHRQQAIYTSKTNIVQIYFLPRMKRNGRQFFIEYEVTGCPELDRPAHAWYKREGNLAVIGCEASKQEWRLTCKGNKWIGEIGNCTTLVVLTPSVIRTNNDGKLSLAVVMTGVTGVAVVLCVIAIVSGTVYLHKYRLRQETRQMKKIYDETERNMMMCYGGRMLTLDQSTSGTWITPQDHMTSYTDPCTCATLADNTKMLPGSVDERQSLYSSIKST